VHFDVHSVYLAVDTLRNYATYGDRAAAEIQQTQGLIERIERAMRGV
jgi:hypothetical protein